LWRTSGYVFPINTENELRNGDLISVQINCDTS